MPANGYNPAHQWIHTKVGPINFRSTIPFGNQDQQNKSKTPALAACPQPMPFVFEVSQTWQRLRFGQKRIPSTAFSTIDLKILPSSIFYFSFAEDIEENGDGSPKCQTTYREEIGGWRDSQNDLWYSKWALKEWFKKDRGSLGDALTKQTFTYHKTALLMEDTGGHHLQRFRKMVYNFTCRLRHKHEG